MSSTPSSPTPYTMNNVDTSLEDAIYVDDNNSTAEESYCSKAASLQLDELLPGDLLPPPTGGDASNALDAAAPGLQTSVTFLGDVTEDEHKAPGGGGGGIMKILGLASVERGGGADNKSDAPPSPGGSPASSARSADRGIMSKASSAETEPESPDKMAPASPLNNISAAADSKKGCDRRWFALASLLALITLAVVIPLVVIQANKDGSSSGDTSAFGSEQDSDRGVPNTATTPAPFALVRRTRTPTLAPTSMGPTVSPGPTPVPTLAPTTGPTQAPVPSSTPSSAPSGGPTIAPTTQAPTSGPSGGPTITPTTQAPSSAPSGGPTGRPTTLSPTRGPTDFFRIAATVSSAQDLLSPGTPQYAALEWLDLVDDWVNLSAVLYTDEQAVQRYVLTLMDVALHGANGTPTNLDPLQPECGWNGVTCDTNGQVVGLNWARSGLVGILPNEMGALAQLSVLDLAENEITGPLPAGLYNLTNLESLYLHQNKLTGSLSDSIENLYSLVNLYLGNNAMTGSIPSTIGSLGGGRGARPLRILNLHKNNFSGRIPTDLKLRFIYYLDLSYNQFTGQLPIDWSEGTGSMARLRHFHLDHNRFTGEIPSTYPTMGNGRIEQFTVNDNMLVGEIPGGWPLRNHLIASNFQNNFFSSIGQGGGGSDVCELIVYSGGEMIEFGADCEICSCRNFCGAGECY